MSLESVYEAVLTGDAETAAAETETALGAAMYEKGDGVFFGGVEIDRFNYIAVDGLIVPSFECELFIVAHACGGEFGGVDIGQLVYVGAVRFDGIDFDGGFERAHGVVDSFGVGSENTDAAVFYDCFDIAGFSVDCEE